MDVLSASAGYSNKVAWYENTDGNGTFGNQRVITFAVGPQTVQTADIDGDQDLDVLFTTFDSDDGEGIVGWCENMDGNGTFATTRAIALTTRWETIVYPGDADSDGDVDVLLNNGAWHKNLDGMGDFGLHRAWSVIPADVDSDGDTDLVSGSYYDGIAWYENTDGNGRFGYPRRITYEATGTVVMSVADFDDDGDLDLLSASSRQRQLAWYENTNGSGSFGPEQVIETPPDVIQSVAAADLDGDGDTDAMWISNTAVAWYQNDGDGRFGLKRVITQRKPFIISARADDIDGDGDLDIVTASQSAGRPAVIAWLENTDGDGTFGAEQLIYARAEGSPSATTADVDGDGDMDVISGGFISWYENLDGRGTLWDPHETDGHYANAIETIDLDRDGDPDVLSLSRAELVWYENIDGKGMLASPHLITSQPEGAHAVRTADIDSDGDPDLLVASAYHGTVTWHEQRLIGDVNDDGVFNSADLVRVFQAGEYDDAERDNSAFDEGDWNGDGDFDSADLVFAFQAGNFVTAVRPATSEYMAAVESSFNHSNACTAPSCLSTSRRENELDSCVGDVGGRTTGISCKLDASES
jgi:hypothetical protein